MPAPRCSWRPTAASPERWAWGGSRGPGDWGVMVAGCHAGGEAVLEAALATKARYVGFIGSRRKIALILRNIARRTGRDPREDERLHAPIGLRLGDKSPGEVALSILAEVVLIKSGGHLEHARLRAREAPKRHQDLQASVYPLPHALNAPPESARSHPTSATDI